MKSCVVRQAFCEGVYESPQATNAMHMYMLEKEADYRAVKVKWIPLRIRWAWLLQSRSGLDFTSIEDIEAVKFHIWRAGLRRRCSGAEMGANGKRHNSYARDEVFCA